VETRRDTHEYPIDLGDATSVKLLIYCPGYKMVAAEFKAKEVSGSKPFAPPFRRLPMAPLGVRLVDSKGRPISREGVSVKHGLCEMEYFGYMDGLTWQATVATATTGADGEIAIEVPSLLDDPFFASHRRLPVGFSLTLPQHRGGTYGWEFVPAMIPAQRNYPEPVMVTVAYRGKISGRVQRSFLARHNLRTEAYRARRGRPKDYYPLWLGARSKVGRSGMVEAIRRDGTFSMVLPAGTYDLSIEVLTETGRFLRKLPVQAGFVLGENENRVINLK
jgi:hypothetical protein